MLINEDLLKRQNPMFLSPTKISFKTNDQKSALALNPVNFRLDLNDLNKKAGPQFYKRFLHAYFGKACTLGYHKHILESL